MVSISPRLNPLKNGLPAIKVPPTANKISILFGFDTSSYPYPRRCVFSTFFFRLLIPSISRKTLSRTSLEKLPLEKNNSVNKLAEANFREG